MKHTYHKMFPDEAVDSIVERLCSKLSETGAHASVDGNRLLIDWVERGFVRSAHLLILDVDDGEDPRED